MHYTFLDTKLKNCREVSSARELKSVELDTRFSTNLNIYWFKKYKQMLIINKYDVIN